MQLVTLRYTQRYLDTSSYIQIYLMYLDISTYIQIYLDASTYLGISGISRCMLYIQAYLEICRCLDFQIIELLGVSRNLDISRNLNIYMQECSEIQMRVEIYISRTIQNLEVHTNLEISYIQNSRYIQILEFRHIQIPDSFQ